MDDKDDDGNFLPDFGDLDPKKYEKYIRKIYKDLTGEDLPSGDIEFMPLDDLKNIGGSKDFLQSMPDEESQEIFDQYIEDNNMDFDVNLTYVDNNLMVEEIWIPEDESATITRIYNYDHIVISKINNKIKELIYSKRLDMLVEEENYEEAAEVRDILNELKDL
jgi:hypothetical protein